MFHQPAAATVAFTSHNTLRAEVGAAGVLSLAILATSADPYLQGPFACWRFLIMIGIILCHSILRTDIEVEYTISNIPPHSSNYYAKQSNRQHGSLPRNPRCSHAIAMSPNLVACLYRCLSSRHGLALVVAGAAQQHDAVLADGSPAAPGPSHASVDALLSLASRCCIRYPALLASRHTHSKQESSPSSQSSAFLCSCDTASGRGSARLAARQDQVSCLPISEA